MHTSTISLLSELLVLETSQLVTTRLTKITSSDRAIEAPKHAYLTQTLGLLTPLLRALNKKAKGSVKKARGTLIHMLLSCMSCHKKNQKKLKKVYCLVDQDCDDQNNEERIGDHRKGLAGELKKSHPFHGEEEPGVV
jgi:hypothetical protein